MIISYNFIFYFLIVLGIIVLDYERRDEFIGFTIKYPFVVCFCYNSKISNYVSGSHVQGVATTIPLKSMSMIGCPCQSKPYCLVSQSLFGNKEKKIFKEKYLITFDRWAKLCLATPEKYVLDITGNCRDLSVNNYNI